MYAKFIDCDNVKILWKKYLTHEGRVYANPPSSIVRAAGYKPLRMQSVPPAGVCTRPFYTEEAGCILVDYRPE